MYNTRQLRALPTLSVLMVVVVIAGGASKSNAEAWGGPHSVPSLSEAESESTEPVKGEGGDDAAIDAVKDSTVDKILETIGSWNKNVSGEIDPAEWDPFSWTPAGAFIAASTPSVIGDDWEVERRELLIQAQGSSALPALGGGPMDQGGVDRYGDPTREGPDDRPEAHHGQGGGTPQAGPDTTGDAPRQAVTVKRGK